MALDNGREHLTASCVCDRHRCVALQAIATRVSYRCDFDRLLQKAISITQAWPYYPLSLELASALAQQQGAPTAAELLDLRISQPSGAFRTSSASLPPV